MRVQQAEVVVVGGGAAGLSAALAAVEDTAVVALLSKVYPMRSHTVAAEGGAAGVLASPSAAGDSLAQHAADTLRAGAGLADPVAVDTLVRLAGPELARLERLGMPWSRQADGQIALRPFGGMSRPRTWFAADQTGFHLLHTLYQTSLRFAGPDPTPAIEQFPEHICLELLFDDDRRVGGVVAYDQQRGEPVEFRAPAVILATGGFARAWGQSTNAGCVTGDGHALALRSGLALRDLELVQVHPTCLPRTGFLVSEAARAEGGVLVDRHGRRYLADYGLGPETPPGAPQPRRMELGPRDALSQAFWRAQQDGRTGEFAGQAVVYLDLRHLDAEVLAQRLPAVVRLAKRYAGVDPATELVPVRPAAHYTMGGIPTTPQGKVLAADGSVVSGLFAAGECASSGVHGANRLGSNSLSETLVAGRLAGRAAAQFAQGRARAEAHPAAPTGGPAPAGDPAPRGAPSPTRLAQAALDLRGQGTEDPNQIRTQLGALLDQAMGIYRSGDALRSAVVELDALAARYAKVRVADQSQVLNTDWAQALELGSMLTVAQAAVAAALAREESRGAHQRLDHPQTDPEPQHTWVTLDTAGVVHAELRPVASPAEACRD